MLPSWCVELPYQLSLSAIHRAACLPERTQGWGTRSLPLARIYTITLVGMYITHNAKLRDGSWRPADFDGKLPIERPKSMVPAAGESVTRGVGWLVL